MRSICLSNRVIHAFSSAFQIDLWRCFPLALGLIARSRAASTGLNIDGLAHSIHRSLSSLNLRILSFSAPIDDKFIVHPSIILILVVTTTALLNALSEGASAGLREERRPVEVLCMLGQHLEVDEVGELVTYHGAVY